MKNKISFKLMMIISYSMLLLIAILSMSIFIGNRMSKNVEDNTKLNVTNTFARENQELERKLLAVDDTFNALSQNDLLIESLRTDKSNVTVYEKYKNANHIEQILYNTYRSNQLIDNIILYSANESFMFAKREKKSPYLNVIQGDTWFQNLVTGSLEIYSDPNSAIYFSPVSKPVYITAKRIYDYRDLHYLGVLVFVIDIGELTNVIKELPFDPNMGIAIVDNKNNILFQNQNIEKIGTAFLDKITEKSFVQNGYTVIDSSRYFTVMGSNDTIGWTVLSLTPEDDIKQGARQVWSYTWKITIVLTIVTCILIILLVYQINRPLNKMLTAIKKVGDGKLNVRINDINYVEFEVLQDSFNQMVEKIHTLIDDIRIKEQEKQRVHMMMLEAQINPHFIYNTLDGIKWVALMQNDRETAKMIAGFVKLLKISAYTKEEFILVRDEIAYFKNYLELIEKRYNTQIKFEYAIAEETLDLFTLKLVIQPIVENSIFHGILDKVQQGIIKISTYIQEQFLIIKVEDNGVGFQPGEHIPQSGDHFSGIGLENVKKRIKLWCGESCGIDIHSELNKGTTVTVIQNIQKKEARADDTSYDR